MIQQPNTEDSFKTFLDKSTNIVTLFGVFNALTVYSSTIDNKVVVGFLFPTFLILSILMWYELIRFAYTVVTDSDKFKLFFGLLSLIQIGLIVYFVTLFPNMVIMLLMYGIYFFMTFGFAAILFKFFAKWVNKYPRGKVSIADAILVLLALVISLIVMLKFNTFILNWITKLVLFIKIN